MLHRISLHIMISEEEKTYQDACKGNIMYTGAGLVGTVATVYFASKKGIPIDTQTVGQVADYLSFGLVALVSGLTTVAGLCGIVKNTIGMRQTESYQARMNQRAEERKALEKQFVFLQYM